MTDKTIQKAGAIILSRENKNKIALLYRGKQNDWSFPKGHVENGENHADAMAREIKEETGLSVEILRELPELNYFHPQGSAISTKMFLAQSKDDTVLKLEHDTDDIKWVSINEVASVLSYDNLREYFKKVANIIKR